MTDITYSLIWFVVRIPLALGLAALFGSGVLAALMVFASPLDDDDDEDRATLDAVMAGGKK